MPLSTKLSSLLDLCVANIARNMDSLWSKDYVETYCKEKGKTYLYVIGPFDSLRKYVQLLSVSHFTEVYRTTQLLCFEQLLYFL